MDAISSAGKSDCTTSTNVGSFGLTSQVGMIVPTVSEEEQQGVRTNGEHLALLPRSVRWRIQLGLLRDPTSSDENHSNIYEEGGHRCSLQAVLEYNRDVVVQQAERFKELVGKHVEEKLDEGENSEHTDSNDLDNSNASAKPSEIDPLTAMLMEQEAQETRKAELYLKYRKERARRKRGLATEARVIESDSDEVDQASLIIIEKDLKRLPHPAEPKQPITGNLSPPTSTPESDARITSLREVLYIYAQENPAMGYRQGMHEIASYLLYVLELEHQDYPEHPLFNPILPICFALLERTLEQLRTAYDASGGKSLQQMSIAILGKILQNNPTLYHHLTNNPNIPPPPIYCTRWVRLMFSREVVGYENVFKLWDVLFSYNNVMQALEIASASRILLISNALLLPENNTLDLLMNVPPLLDITPLTDTLDQLMKQRENDRAINLQQYQRQTMEPLTSQNRENANHLEQPARQRQSPSSGVESMFSFHNMRQSLNQKSESLRKKIITTTVEWKEAASRRDNNLAFDPLLGVTSVIQSRSKTSCLGNEGQNEQQSNPQRVYGDSAMASPALADGRIPSEASATLPITPKQHQHEMWSKLLQQKIWTVQQFLLDLESKENQGSVPRDVWEALADMDRMQRELLNYSQSNIVGGSGALESLEYR
mmetsp:Transcript_14878/g.41426  ORF Transcript_14878/g.41426 Transcript_14878/m.41426 type:complete len:656 (+) Transcript_14878:96-2063(+)|eukprot:CAMPEP_0172359698 /NCGR_PEP_ID=MMETSP1060-20121228/3881_1 /TAXON_ID=37318 /ORGANISM="Pseudo-nitzschia pungens, Strain cf. cingulata" /LENGTH=655 /DNA_ID=CAMNT_0013081479 /DNA_START=226 /DNA_END=2193 /DNA_ORIENTATION=+